LDSKGGSGMLKNERGNSLITVMLVSLVFTTLGLAVIASSIGGAKRVETRETDIHTTYHAVEVVEKIMADLATSKETLALEWDNNLPNKSIFETKLKNFFEKSIQKYGDEKFVECLTIVDISSSPPKSVASSNSCLEPIDNSFSYDIETDKDFTRAFEIVLVTKNPIEYEGKITRTIRKRFILSPLPSFLKYAVGSFSDEKEKGLFLNGSANIYGNVYANQLNFNDGKAKYQKKNGDWDEQSTPMSSINGDIYSSTANLLPLMKKENFYKESVPDLKHDSQFINIEFERTMNNETNKILKASGLSTERYGGGTDFSTELREEIQNKFFSSSSSIHENNDIHKVENQINPLSLIGDSSDELEDSFLIENTEEPIPEYFDGDLVINSKDHPITLDNRLAVNGDLYLVSYQDIKLLDHVYVAGKLHIINLDGEISFDKNIICADSIHMESYADKQISKGLKINGDLVTGNDLTVKALNSAIEFNSNMIVNDSLKITGDESDDELEDDEVIFDSVVYVGGKAFLSNVNILGAEENKKQLVLMSKKELVITRMNEFNNFHDPDEGEKPYLPSADDQIKPLKAFFYTEDKAELYGVGSLFYINGGIFAKERLEINAVRGEVKNIHDLPSKLSQKDKFSRFIVEYNKNVLLDKVDALPIVEQLQVFSDEMMIE
jgi:hypothetical protein